MLLLLLLGALSSFFQSASFLAFHTFTRFAQHCADQRRLFWRPLIRRCCLMILSWLLCWTFLSPAATSKQDGLSFSASLISSSTNTFPLLLLLLMLKHSFHLTFLDVTVLVHDVKELKSNQGEQKMSEKSALLHCLNSRIGLHSSQTITSVCHI